MPYYAVAKGRNPGIYNTWDECKAEVHQYSGPQFKKFSTRAEAENFISAHEAPSQTSNWSSPKTYSSNYSYPSASQRLGNIKRPSPSASMQDSNYQKRRKTQVIDFPSCSNSKTDNTRTDKSGFLTDDNGYVNVYTDGACSQNGKNKAKAGVGVWFGDDNPLNISRPVLGRQTNNMAEIQAVTLAAKQAQQAGIQKLKINTDSQFLINCKTKWMNKWKATGWRTANGQPVINKHELLEMEAALAPLDVSWNHVRGHAGIHGNEMADKLARAGANN